MLEISKRTNDEFGDEVAQKLGMEEWREEEKAVVSVGAELAGDGRRAAKKRKRMGN